MLNDYIALYLVMKEKEDTDFWVTKICNSKAFTSSADSRLFRYLVDASLSGKMLKETVIAVEIFGRDPTFNPGDDSIVRSSIYNLRKKLETYYRDEGQKDTIRIAIPKGSYQVIFKASDEIIKPEEIKKRFTKTRILSITTLLLSLVTSIVILLYSKQRLAYKNLRMIENNNFFWSDFISSGKPLLIVLGDYFMMERIQTVDSSRSYIRNPFVNTPEDFMAFRDMNPEIKGQMKAFGMSYFGEEIPWGLMKIIEVFKGTEKKIDVKYSSKITPDDLRNNDIIFFGDFSTLTILKSFLYQTHYRFKLSPPAVYYCADYSDTTEIVTISNRNETDFQNDYALVAKITGYQGSKILLFLSFSAFGKTEAIYKVTDPAFQNEIAKFSSEKPVCWDLFLKVSGLGTSGFDYEILRFDPINKK